MERKDLLSRKDLFNIEHQYNLKSEAIRHSNDGISVESWIQEMKTAGEVVRFYKPQGILLETHSQFRAEDFVLIIMNEAQKDMLKQYGNNYICCDSTHGLNCYDFELTTLLILQKQY